MLTSWSARLQKALVLPLVVLVVALLETIAAYKVTRMVANLNLRVVILMVLNGVGFSIAAARISPWLRDVVTASRRTSQRTGGPLGAWLFFAVAYGLLYYAYYLLATRGAAALLPHGLR